MNEKRSIDFLPQIDGLRFLAVLGVMIHHWLSQSFSGSFILRNIPFGTGVNLFFVISGFLITYILLRKKGEIEENKSTYFKEIKNFYVKRTLRIFPIYYLLITFLFVFGYENIKSYFVYLITYTVNWYMVFNDTFIAQQSHLWSLAVEEQFYLIWPFLIFFVPRRYTILVIFFSIIISLASKVYFSLSAFPMGVNGATFSCFDSFGMGALVAIIQIKNKALFTERFKKIILYLSILLFILLFVNPGYLSPNLKNLLFNFSTSFVFMFMVLIAANSEFKGITKAFLENNVILYFGRISYGLYLYHNYLGTIFFTGINQYFPNIKSDLDISILFFIFNVILASISWYLIERPILSLKKYFQ